jgi:hypothetical protein
MQPSIKPSLLLGLERKTLVKCLANMKVTVNRFKPLKRLDFHGYLDIYCLNEVLTMK